MTKAYSNQKKLLRNRKQTKLIIAICVALIVIGVVVFALTRPEKTPLYIDTPKKVSSNDNIKSDQTSTPSSPTEDQPTQDLPTIAQPLLSKSSGNNGSVPNKASVQFICSGTLNSSCTVSLSNDAETLKFDAKTIKDDGRGNTSVSWIWEAKPGTWTARATISASGYQPNSSDPQSIKVDQ